MGKLIKNDIEYKQWFTDLKQRVRQCQLKAAVKVNSEMLRLYGSIGADIVKKINQSTWGDAIIPQLSQDLMHEFPDMKGFSPTNLKYMRMFYLFYFDETAIGQQPVDQIQQEYLFQIPWGHHILLFTKCKSREEAFFYIQKSIENGWSRNLLMNFLDRNLFGSEGYAITNFSLQLPNNQSDLAQQSLKDPYNFDFLTMRQGYNERELEDALTANITKFLIELGSGFSYVGRQQRIQVGESEFFIDLLFYHIKLRCFVVVELKTGEFKAEYVSKLGLYVSAVNHQMRHSTDQPTIGLLICKTKDEVVAKYTLESTSQPIGISEYQLKELYPEKIEGAIPSIEEIESEL